MSLQPYSSRITEGIRQARRETGDGITTTDVARQQAEVAAKEPPVLPRQPVPSPLEPAADTEPAVGTGPEADRQEPVLGIAPAASDTCSTPAEGHSRGPGRDPFA